MYFQVSWFLENEESSVATSDVLKPNLGRQTLHLSQKPLTCSRAFSTSILEVSDLPRYIPLPAH